MKMALSILPLLAAVLGAAISKRIIPSLVGGLLVGALIKSGSLIGMFTSAGNYLVGVLSDKGNAYIVLFLFSFGALAEIFKVGGGITGFANRVKPFVKSEKGALLSVWAATPISFLDCCFHVISTTTITKPLIEDVKGSKEKLAFVINTTSSQLIMLIPFATTYVGYILGLIGSSLSRAGIGGSPFLYYIRGIYLNFYSIAILIISLLFIFVDLSFLKIPQPAYKMQTSAEGEHSSSEAEEQGDFEEKAPPRLMNLLIPLGFLLIAVTYFLWLTGKARGGSFLQAIIQADYESSIFIGTLATLVVTALLYAVQKIPMKKIESSFLAGGVDLLPPIVILILAWSIAEVTKDLGFAGFVSGFVKTSFSSNLIPLAIFIIGGLASYFMGSSWGTWALMMPLAISTAAASGASIPLTIGAVLAGGSIGDSISPLGETPVTTATLLGLPVMEHVRFVLPYGLVAIGVSVLLYLLTGYAMR